MKRSSIFYLIVILSFLMPFFLVKCSDTEHIKFTGMDLVLGKMSQTQDDSGKTFTDDAKPNWQACAALFCAFIGVGFCLTVRKVNYVIPIIISSLGILMLLLLYLYMINDLSGKPGFMKSVKIQVLYGYWIAISAFMLGAISLIIFKRYFPSKH